LLLVVRQVARIGRSYEGEANAVALAFGHDWASVEGGRTEMAGSQPEAAVQGDDGRRISRRPAV
jgi:hypothetical protein